MLRRFHGVCNQDVWCPIDSRIAISVSAPLLLLYHPWNPLLAIRSLTVASIGVWHAFKCGPVNPSLINGATYISLVVDLCRGGICMPSCHGGSTYPDLFYRLINTSLGPIHILLQPCEFRPRVSLLCMQYPVYFLCGVKCALTALVVRYHERTGTPRLSSNFPSML